MVHDQDFVLEAYTLFGRNNTKIDVSPNTNFIKIYGDRLTVQTGNNFVLSFNCLGGVIIKFGTSYLGSAEKV